jgi:sec-independent protein translocase protein TatC
MSESTTNARNIIEGSPPKAELPKLTIEMSFLDHLEELRWRILKGLSGFLVGVVIAFIFSEFFIDEILLGPAKASFFIYNWLGIDAVDLVLQNRTLPGQFFSYWGTLFVVGLILGSPIFFFQIWSFIEPALENKEKQSSSLVVASITGMFTLGLLFGYLILTPFALQFFATFQLSEAVRNDFDITAYFSSLTMWTISCGIIFQLPFISYSLSRIGLLTPEFMRKYRRIAIVFCFIGSAFLTPPDPISQFIVAIPLILLYEVGIFISKITNDRRNRIIWGTGGKPSTS